MIASWPLKKQIKYMKIKVCGMRESDNLKELIALDIDYVGFIFYPESRRFVTDEQMEGLFAIPPLKIQKVGVFVDQDLTMIIDKCQRYMLPIVQLHGNESMEECLALKQEDLGVIKAFGMSESVNFHDMEPYIDAVDCFLFDTSSTKFGGTGRLFNWDILKSYPYDTPYFLSGGLSLENLQRVKAIKDERLIGLDLNSKFEILPGLKAISKVAQAVEIIRSIESEDLQ